MNRRTSNRAIVLIATMIVIVAVSAKLNADTGPCGSGTTTLPFTDVPAGNIFFCSIAEAFLSGLSNGTTATTYGPSANVPREQMAAFVTRTLDQSGKRTSKRAALDQFWTDSLALTNVGPSPIGVRSDGADLWVSNAGDNTVSRVRASDGRLLETWTGATNANGVLVAKGKVFVTGTTDPGKLYQIDPTQSAGAVTVLTSNLGDAPEGITFDGQRIWTANVNGSISIVTLTPLTVTTVTSEFISPLGIIYDGTNIWLADIGDNSLKKLGSSGNILVSVPVGSGPVYPVFDGTNIWVPNSQSNSVSVVRASGGLAGTVLATLTGNGLDGPNQAAFDGERVLVTNSNGNSVSSWNASDLTPIGNFPTGSGTQPKAVCSDGLNFWITLGATGKLARF